MATESTQSSPGLMQAIEPIAKRRPIHLIISDAGTAGLRVVFQPSQAGAGEDPALSQGFTVEGTAPELDEQLASTLSAGFIPAHRGLQATIDEATQVATAAKEAQQRKATAGKKGTGAAATTTPTPQRAAANQTASAAAAPAATTAETQPSAAQPEEAPVLALVGPASDDQVAGLFD